MNYPVQNNLGKAFIPFTFPTMTVGIYLRKGYPRYDWNETIIDTIYGEYEHLVSSGKADPYPNSKIVDLIATNTGYNAAMIRIFMYVLVEMSKKGLIEPKWIMQNKKKNDPIASINNALQKSATSIKWTGILVITGAVLYFGWPILKRIRKRMK